VDHNLVLVIWRDTREVDTGTWHDRKEVGTTASSVIHSVGWVIEENTVDIKISADIPADITDTEVGRTTVIPRGCVEEIINVRCIKEND
jgi:hypothetical protein